MGSLRAPGPKVGNARELGLGVGRGVQKAGARATYEDKEEGRKRQGDGGGGKYLGWAAVRSLTWRRTRPYRQRAAVRTPSS